MRMSQLSSLRLQCIEVVGKEIQDISEKTILPQSIEECPIRTGALRDTGRVNKPKISPNTYRVELAYGGISKKFGTRVDYAVIQHEKYEHKRTPGTKWKYLEDPIKRNVQNIYFAMASAFDFLVKRVFNG